MYTRSFGLSVSSGTTVTTTTRTITETAYETGCPLPLYTTTAACGTADGNAKRQIRTALATATATPALAPRAAWSEDWRYDMVGCFGGSDTAFYLIDGAAESDIDTVMDRLSYTGLINHRYQHHSLGTILIFVQNLPWSLYQKIMQMPGVG